MAYRLHLHRLPSLRPSTAGQAVTVGNFDGVHLGHQALVSRMARSGLPGAVLTFEPLPREYFQGAAAPVRLSSLREKFWALRQAGLDTMVCTSFNATLAALPAETFVREILVGRLQARALHVGHDFRFGAGRRGDLHLLRRMGRDLGFDVFEHEPVLLEGRRISSTGIRQFLQTGDLASAARWLGRPYAICGRVSQGNRLGRELGFPTANLPLQHRPVPLRGIFAGVLHGAQQSWLAAVSIGLRPTVGGKHLLLEAHCLDGSPSLYGQIVQIELHQKLRDEMKYPDLDALQDAIAEDVRRVRSHFSLHPVNLDQPWTTKPL